MRKKVLIVYYSQTGQLTRILENLVHPLKEVADLEFLSISPQKEFEFPWKGKDFYAAMPDSVLGKPVPLKNFEIQHGSYDLVIFGYQPWFLSPSIPATSILMDEKIKAILRGTPVVTVIGARNMWLNSQEKIKKLLAISQAKLVGNIALVDHHHNLSSAVSIVNWLLYGNKGRLWGIFPPAGISENDIESAGKFGELMKDHISSDNWSGFQEKIVAAGGVEVRQNIMFIESKAGRLFAIWANLISKSSRPELMLKVFKYYLAIALFVASPVVLLLDMLLLRPFTQGRRRQQKLYFQGTELSSEE